MSHWDTLDWLIYEDFITFDEIKRMAFKAWRVDRNHGLDTTFETALGFAIQEADIQYETVVSGFTNDNGE